MSNTEHYFENLIFHGQEWFHPNWKDPNIKELSKEEKQAIDICYSYLEHTLFNNREDLNNFLKERCPWLEDKDLPHWDEESEKRFDEYFERLK